jgi:hypothetical protein
MCTTSPLPRRLRSVLAACALGWLLAACSGSDPAPEPSPAGADAAFADEAAGQDGPEHDAGADVQLEAEAQDGVQDGAQDAASPGLNIAFDYKFDTKGAFGDEQKKAVLVAAAQKWSEVLLDEFGDIPAGTEVLVRDPQLPAQAGTVFTYDKPIDDLLVFVGYATLDGQHGTLGISAPSAAIGSVSDPALRALLQQRYEGPDFEPWTGWLGFDEAEDWFVDPTPQTSDDLPGAKIDLMSVALHELGHVLGFGTCGAFSALVQSGTFTGQHAVAVHGGPVPLSADSRHIAKGVLSDGRKPVMDPTDSAGERSVITSLDLAILRDIGYQTAP